MGPVSTAMSQVDTRQVPRESLFLLAQLRVEGDEAEHRARVRNLSAGGMMAECDVGVARGSRVSVHLRHAGWVEGSVAWTQDNRFGIAFAKPIDPAQVRESVSAASAEADGFQRFPSPATPDPRKLRKI